MNLLEGPEATLDAFLEPGEGPTSREGFAPGCLVQRATARTALSPSALEGFDWALNPYVGCAHECAYCYAPAVLRMDRAEWGRRVGVRQNIPALLSRELRRKNRGVVGISTVTDPYQPPERRFQLTRLCLERLRAADWPVCVLTKSDLVVRDLDLLESFSQCEVGFTVTTLDEHQRRLMEPGAPSVARRLAAMRYLSSAGVHTYAFIGPIYPTAKASELREIVRQVHGAGATSILMDGLNLKRGVWASVTRALSADPILTSLARRRMFPTEGDEDFYGRAFACVREEAEALGLTVSLA